MDFFTVKKSTNNFKRICLGVCLLYFREFIQHLRPIDHASFFAFVCFIQKCDEFIKLRITDYNREPLLDELSESGQRADIRIIQVLVLFFEA